MISEWLLAELTRGELVGGIRDEQARLSHGTITDYDTLDRLHALKGRRRVGGLVLRSRGCVGVGGMNGVEVSFRIQEPLDAGRPTPSAGRFVNPRRLRRRSSGLCCSRSSSLHVYVEVTALLWTERVTLADSSVPP